VEIQYIEEEWGRDLSSRHDHTVWATQLLNHIKAQDELIKYYEEAEKCRKAKES
jgi:hypothetical protein